MRGAWFSLSVGSLPGAGVAARDAPAGRMSLNRVKWSVWPRGADVASRCGHSSSMASPLRMQLCLHTFVREGRCASPFRDEARVCCAF
jgi:hypothetical protein